MFPRRALALFLACGFALTPSLPALANDCEVSPYAAFQVAQARGWNFRCTDNSFPFPGSFTGFFMPEPPQRIGCRWQTGLVSVPTPPRVNLIFFSRGDFRAANGGLRNGWRISAWELSGGNYTVTNATDARVFGRVTLAHRNRTYHYRLTRLVLTKPGGSCANALNEAF
jgi:hypothetical protein